MEEARRAAAAQLARLAELNREARKRRAAAAATPASATDHWKQQAAGEGVGGGRVWMSAEQMGLRSTASKGKSKARDMGTYGGGF